MATVDRDRRNVHMLRALGWRVIVVWECETGGTVGVARVALKLRNWAR
jgi:G:T-mismatch repair DNA endonuclease (very short patch repair protein)